VINFIGIIRIVRFTVVIILEGQFEMLVLLLLVMESNHWYCSQSSLRIVLEQANLNHRPLDQIMSPNTRAASRKPALLTLRFLLKLRSLVTPIIPIRLINSVILTTCYIQINSNHLLGFRGLLTLLCVDATQKVILLELLRVIRLSRL
jgi:hypothetical protein